MARLGQHRLPADVTTPQDGAGAPEAKAAPRYCALCGQEVTTNGPAIERFSEAFCSDSHAEEFVTTVRAARVQAAAATLATTEVEERGDAVEKSPKQQSWKGLLKMGLCCGLPLLALVVLAGGGGAVLGAAGALLPVLAMLACPLGMYFMMRSMAKTGRHGNSKDKEGDR